MDTKTFSANRRHSSSEPCHAASQCMKRLQPAARPPAVSHWESGMSQADRSTVDTHGTLFQIFSAFCTMLFVCLHAWKCKHLRRRLVRELRHGSLQKLEFLTRAGSGSTCERVNCMPLRLPISKGLQHQKGDIVRRSISCVNQTDLLDFLGVK